MKQFWGTRRASARWLLITFICGVLIYPSVHLRRGHLDADELKTFPTALKRTLQISAWLTIVGLVWMAITYAFINAI